MSTPTNEIRQDYYTPGPVATQFINSDAFIRGIRGPVGSGKSTLCVMDMFHTACLQPNVNGVRKYRGLITRNTYGELLSTTIKTFHAWIPPETGRYVMGAPIVQQLRHPLDDGSIVDAEFLFLALDRPDHIRKLLSLEVTQAWMNEAREQAKAILDHLTVRVGRYPGIKDGGCVRAGVIMDTNSPDTDHWWPQLSDNANADLIEQTHELEQELIDMGAMKAGDKLMEFFTQPPAEGMDGKQNDLAENIKNLPPGYYVKAKVGKTQEWIKVYIRNEYGFIMEGKAVFPEYRDHFHAIKCAYNPKLKLHIGMDFGLTPAAVFTQRTPMGQVRVLSELCATRLGAKNFAREIKAHLVENYGEIGEVPIGKITGDPAGTAAAQTDETTVFQMLETEGVRAKPAHTNDLEIRRESVATPLGLLIDGEPGLIINTSCKALRKAMSGGYHYRRIQVTAERYEDKPYKNMSSHVAEALQYNMLGLGMGKEALVKPEGFSGRQGRATTAAAHDPHNY